jgi:hypothetical protein
VKEGRLKVKAVLLRITIDLQNIRKRMLSDSHQFEWRGTAHAVGSHITGNQASTPRMRIVLDIGETWLGPDSDVEDSPEVLGLEVKHDKRYLLMFVGMEEVQGQDDTQACFLVLEEMAADADKRISRELERI